MNVSAERLSARLIRALSVVYRSDSPPPNMVSDAARRGRETAVTVTSWFMLADLGVQVIVNLASVPLLVRHLGPELYGLWAAVAGAMALLSFSDLGVGVGVQNQLTKAYAEARSASARALVGTTVAFLGGVLLILVAALVILPPLLPVASWLGASGSGARTLAPGVVQLTGLGLAVGILCGLSQRVADALLVGWVYRKYLAVARVVALATLVALVVLGAGSLWLIFAVALLPNLLVLACVAEIKHHRSDYLPSRLAFEPELLRRTLSTGLRGLLAAASYAALAALPALVLAQRLGAAEAAPFSVAFRVVSLVMMVTSTFILALWPAYADAAARRDWTWIKYRFWKSTLNASLAYASFAIVLLAVGRRLLLLWIGEPAAVPSQAVLAGCVVFGGVNVLNAGLSTLLNGLNRYTGQGLYGLLIAAGAAVVAWTCPREWGSAAVVWVFAAAMAARVAVLGLEARFVVASASR